MFVERKLKRERADSISRSPKRCCRAGNGNQSLSIAAATGNKPERIQDQSQSHSQSHSRSAQSAYRAYEEQLAARLLRMVLKPDGVLTNEYQELFMVSFEYMIRDAAQNRLNFSRACCAGRKTDGTLSVMGLPPRWDLLKILPKDLPRGLVQLEEEVATYLKTNCEELAQQVCDRTFNVDSVQKFADVLRTVMEPLMEPCLSGALELFEGPKPPPLEYVTLLSKGHRAALSTAFTNTVALVNEDKLSAASLVQLHTAINDALVSVGKRVRRVVSPEQMPDDEGVRARLETPRQRFLPLEIKDNFQALERGVLPLFFLENLAIIIGQVLDDAMEAVD